MGKGMPVTQREKFIEMIDKRFKPCLNLAKLLTVHIRDEERKKLEDEWGVTEALNKKRTLLKQVEAIENRITDIFGSANEYGSSKFEPQKDSAFYEELEERVQGRDGLLKEITDTVDNLRDQVWLQGAPEDMQKLLASIDGNILPDMTKKLEKAKGLMLPEGKSQ